MARPQVGAAALLDPPQPGPILASPPAPGPASRRPARTSADAVDALLGMGAEVQERLRHDEHGRRPRR